jgi:hypothetical protein
MIWKHEKSRFLKHDWQELGFYADHRGGVTVMQWFLLLRDDAGLEARATL